jgi:branched-chain amino acid transport system substrate-binding protein
MKRADPQLVLGGTYLDDSIAFVRHAKSSGLSPKLMAFTVGPALPEFGEALGADADGVMGAVAWMRGASLPMAQDFSYRYKEKFGYNAGAHAVYGYAAGQVLEAGVRLAGSLDKAAIREQLGALKFRSLLGRYRVDERGLQQDKSVYLMQWQDGRRRLILPERYARNKVRFPLKSWSER